MKNKYCPRDQTRMKEILYAFGEGEVLSYYECEKCDGTLITDINARILRQENENDILEKRLTK